MQTSLFPSEPPNQPLVISEDKIIQPLAEILEKVSSTPENLQQTQDKNNLQSIKQSLDELFPEQRYEEKDNQKAKAILGEIVNELTTDQFTDAITEVKYLCETWLDDFERELFDGLTLKELLHEKGR